MVSTILNKLIAFGMSMPTNLIGKIISDCIKVIIGYLLIGLLLSFFGITMPSFLQIGRWIVSVAKSLW